MSELQDLYQEVILDHFRRPRNTGTLGHANRHAEGQNPLCGDEIKLWLNVEDGVVKDVSFTGVGCAISTASASMMSEAVKGKRIEEVEALFEKFHMMVAGKDAVNPDELGKLQALSGVREFPVRVKCATLAWHTMKAALAGAQDVVTTETGDE